MISTGKLKNRRRGAWLLCILFSLALACLVCTQAAECRASDGSFVVTDWVRRYHGPLSLRSVNAMAADGQGNVYVTGSSFTVYGNSSVYLTLKYSSSGRLLWARVYSSEKDLLGDNDYAEALAVDGQGNVYVTGFSILYPGNGGHSLITTVKYSPDGEELWVQRYENPTRGNEAAGAIALDTQGNVYVTGSVTIKYAPDGQELWLRDFTHGIAIAVDGQNNICATGYAWNAETGYDYVTIKYDSDGQQLWKRRYNGPGNGDETPHSMALDKQGNIYITGSSVGSGTRSNSVLIKYNPDGRRLWVRRYKKVGDREYGPTAMALDAQGNIYVTGNSRFWNDPNEISLASTIKFSPDGRLLWTRRYYGPNGGSYAAALVVDALGNAYVSGSATIKYSPGGQKLWARKLINSSVATAMALDGQGNVYVSGDSYVSPYITDCLTIKYRQNP